MNTRLIVALLVACVVAPIALAAEVNYTRAEDVVYGRKFGTALTMDVFTPKANPNGAGVVMVVSGGWFSSHEAINPAFFQVFLSRGYTVFAVVHGSQPKFTIPEVMDDMHRSVRFIRSNAARFNIDAERLGITGASAGGHLSLMIGTSGRPGDANAKDPIDRASSRVQAVACFFPPTDFMNYGEPGRDVLKALEGELAAFKAPFDFRELDRTTRRFVTIEDRDRRLQIAKDISPITHVTPDDPPTLIIHGDADRLVPIQQAQAIIEKLEQNKVKAKLVVREKQGHGWPTLIADTALFADWFDECLKKK